MLNFVGAEGEQILAAASMGYDPVVTQVSELLNAKKMLSASELRSGKSVLDVKV